VRRANRKKKWEMGGSEECLKRIYGCKNVYCFCILSFFFLPVFILGVWGSREGKRGDVSVSKLLHWLPLDR